MNDSRARVRNNIGAGFKSSNVNKVVCSYQKSVRFRSAV